MQRITLLILSTLFYSLILQAQSQMQTGDTLVVHAVTFADPSPEGWGAQYKQTVQFPTSHESWAKIVMVQWLKCDASTKADKYPCGEWDYIWDTYLKLPQKDTFEIMSLGSFVTPYGKRLDLGGEKGWQWTYDITDYAPLLKGELEMVTGNNQELLDLKFLFIKGKPIREVLKVENIYPYGNYKYELLADDSVLQARKFQLMPEADGYRLKARISGHGHAGPRNCCEWDSKTHSYYINGWDHFRWNVWKDCGNNPIYPQGGTWPFDRAGWCPGTKVDEYEFELTPIVKSGDTINFDYSIEYYSDNGEKDGTFRMSHQLFSYGPVNFENDVAINEIVAPNSAGKYARINPICGSPRIIIKNTGSNLLKSCKIFYGIVGQKMEEYTWHGELAFLETEEIWLPALQWSSTKSKMTFEVKAENPNNSEDENVLNNTLYSTMEWPTVFPNRFTIDILTNNLGRPVENTLKISDTDGKVFYSKNDFSDSTSYQIPIKLADGCYQLIFTDDKEDGISYHWWNYRDEPEKVGINGKIKIISKKEEVLHQFHPDFGQELRLNFWVGDLP